MSNNRDYRSRDNIARASLHLHIELMLSMAAAGLTVPVASQEAFKAVREISNRDLIRIGRGLNRPRLGKIRC